MSNSTWLRGSHVFIVSHLFLTRNVSLVVCYGGNRSLGLVSSMAQKCLKQPNFKESAAAACCLLLKSIWLSQSKETKFGSEGNTGNISTHVMCAVALIITCNPTHPLSFPL